MRDFIIKVKHQDYSLPVVYLVCSCYYFAAWQKVFLDSGKKEVDLVFDTRYKSKLKLEKIKLIYIYIYIYIYIIYIYIVNRLKLPIKYIVRVMLFIEE